MPRASKRAQNCRDMRAAKKRKAEEALYGIPDTVLDLMWKLGVRRTGSPGLRPSATGHWEDLQLNGESGGQPENLLSDSESVSEEVEMTDDEGEDLPFDGCL